MSSTERSRALRERRRRAMEAADAAEVALRDVDTMLEPSISETITAIRLGPEDAAAAQLARQYARVIDRAKDQAYAMRWLAPLLLDTLTALNATPMARAKLKPTDRGAHSNQAGLTRCGRPGGQVPAACTNPTKNRAYMRDLPDLFVGF